MAKGRENLDGLKLVAKYSLSPQLCKYCAIVIETQPITVKEVMDITRASLQTVNQYLVTLTLKGVLDRNTNGEGIYEYSYCGK
jgi:predicted transcriptional regulator